MILGDLRLWLLISFNVTLEGYKAFGVIRAEEDGVVRHLKTGTVPTSFQVTKNYLSIGK